MTIYERLEALIMVTERHSKQLHQDGRHIKQLATAIQDHHRDMEKLSEEVTKVNNGIQALVEIIARHQTRPERLEERR